MKIKIIALLLGFVLAFLPNLTHSQSVPGYTFTYDASGNRTSRT